MKMLLSLVAILLIGVVIPVTFSDHTQPEENHQAFQAKQAQLVNFLIHLFETLNDFDEADFNEELLENLQIEFELALTVAKQSTMVATVEYSLGFLRMAYTSLLEEAIADKVEATISLVDEMNTLNEGDFTPSSWMVLQASFTRAEAAIQEAQQALDALEIGLGGDSHEVNESDESPEILVSTSPDSTPHLRALFDELVEINGELASSYHELEASMMLETVSNEIEADEFDDEIFKAISDVHDESEEQKSSCPRDDDECRVAWLQVTRFELHRLLMNINDEIHQSSLGFELWNGLQNSMQHAVEALANHDLEEMIIAHELLEVVFTSLE